MQVRRLCRVCRVVPYIDGRTRTSADYNCWAANICSGGDAAARQAWISFNMIGVTE